jgi:hypothetical protein
MWPQKEPPGNRAEEGAECPDPSRYFFLLAAAFALVACCDVISACFFWFESLFFDCFCDACFCTDLGDLSPMVEPFR